MNNILFSDLTKIYNLALNPIAPNLLTELNKTKDYVELFDKIFIIAKKMLSVDSEYSEYFTFYESQIRYELYMKIYDALYLARKIQNPVKLNQSEYARHYADISGLAVSTLKSKISENLKTICNDCITFKHFAILNEYDPQKASTIPSDYEKLKSFTSPFHLKRNIYYDYVYIPQGAKTIIEYSPIKLDIAFNLYKHDTFIYSANNSDYGIHINNYHKLATTFGKSHIRHDTFDHEHSVYIFEKLHGMIGYQRCFYNYLETFANESIPTDNYFLLYEYTKLFDTTHPSLSDYMLDNYKELFKNLLSKEGKNTKSDDNKFADNKLDEFINLFVKMQTLNLWVLPLITLTIENLLFSIFVNDYSLQFGSKTNKPLNEFYESAYDDFKTVEDKTKCYLQYQIHTSCKDFTYSKRLDEINEIISNYKYNITSKKVINSQASKTESDIQIFNNLLSHCFYLKSLPQFITDKYYCHYIDCYKALHQYMYSAYNTLKSTSFYSCTEYLNHLANKK